ncbi:hypothetical protein ACFSQ7_01175 [Paenibacillus rhizoplanae]
MPLTSIGAQQTEYVTRHNLLVPMNVEIKQDGYQVNITGFMADKNQLILFYTARVDGGRSLFSDGPHFVECIITDGITGKVINGRTHALVSSSSPEQHIKDAIARLPFSTPLTDPPSKIKVEFHLRTLGANDSNIQESPALQTTFDVRANYWKQESHTITSQETLNVAGHKIKVKLQLTPLTTIATFFIQMNLCLRIRNL